VSCTPATGEHSSEGKVVLHTVVRGEWAGLLHTVVLHTVALHTVGRHTVGRHTVGLHTVEPARSRAGQLGLGYWCALTAGVLQRWHGCQILGVSMCH
jgi:hypothetical protein